MNEIVRQRFSIIPAMAVTDQRLEPRDLQVLCLLGRHTDDMGWCCRSQVKMAKELNCGRATVQRALGRLVEAGYLEHRSKQRASGADSAHDYRVVIDPPEASAKPLSKLATAPENDGEGVPTGGQGCPPIDGQGVPTHERAPMLTTPVKRSERERGREDGKSEPDEPASDDHPPQSREQLERRFWKLAKAHPGSAGMPKQPWLKAWLALEPDERDRAERRHGAWLALLKAQSKTHVPALSTYFAEKLFDEVADPADAPEPTVVDARPFGPLWAALVMRELLCEPGQLPRASTFLEQLMAEDSERGAAERLRHRSRWGWPTVIGWYRQAESRKGFLADIGDGPLGDLTEPVPVDGEMMTAWRAEFDRRGWPWLPDWGGMRVVYLPKGGPEGLGEFEQALARIGAEGDTTCQEAAE